MKDVRALHDKFDEIYDKDKMADKLSTEWYNLEELDKEDNIMYSTDFTSEEEDE